MFSGLLVAAAAALSLVAPAPAKPTSAPQPIVIGTSHAIRSTALGDERTINVVLPAGYAKANKRYPVIYLIDGGVDQDLLHVAGVAQLGSIWGRMDEAILVGVATRDRRRELAGPTSDPELIKKYPTAGASAAFRAFLRDEVKTLVKPNYRTSGNDVVIGESLAGLFIVETYMVEPGLFDGFAAIDPSLWWDKEALSRRTALIGERQRGKRLYLAMAKEQSEEPAAITRIVSAGEAARSNLCLAPRPDLTHATIYQQLEQQALQFLLPPAQAAPPEFGFEVRCSPRS